MKLTFPKRSLILAVAILATLNLSQALADEPPLVTRNRVALNLAGAEKVIAAAKEKAVALKLKVNVAVVDDGGHLLAFARMDDARPASVATAITKATAA